MAVLLAGGMLLAPPPIAAQRVGIVFDGIGPPLDQAVLDSFDAVAYYDVVRFDEAKPAKRNRLSQRARAAIERKSKAARKAYTSFKLTKARDLLKEVVITTWEHPLELGDVETLVDTLMLWGGVELMLGEEEAALEPIRQAIAFDAEVEPDPTVFTPTMREKLHAHRAEFRAQGAGKLTISSKPSGAAVFVDGTFVGSSPAVVDSLLPGRHLVHLSKPAHAPWGGAPEVVAGTEISLEATLEPTDRYEAYLVLEAALPDLAGVDARLSEEARAAAAELGLDQVVVARKGEGNSVRVDQFGVMTGKRTGTATAELGDAGGDRHALRVALALIPSTLLPRGGKLGAGAIQTRGVRGRELTAFKKDLSVAMAPREAAIVFSEAVLSRGCFESPKCIVAEAGLLEVEALLDLQLTKHGRTQELRSRLFAAADGQQLGKAAVDVVSGDEGDLRVVVGRWLGYLAEVGLARQGAPPSPEQIEKSGREAAEKVAATDSMPTIEKKGSRTGYLVSGTILSVAGAALVTGGYLYYRTWNDAKYDPQSTPETLDKAPGRARAGLAGSGLGVAAVVAGAVLLLYGASGS